MSSTVVHAGRAAAPEYVVAKTVTQLDVDFAVRTVMTHRPQCWPTGTLCRNDHLPYPCGLRIWAMRVLHEAGVDYAEPMDPTK